MKHFNSLYAILLFSMVFFGCSSHVKLKQHQDKIDVSLIPSSLFLENRVDNCDSAIVFMKAVISPGGVPSLPYKGYRIKGESTSFLNKVRDTKKMQFANNIRFYISTQCLIGQDIQTVLDIFVPSEFHQKIWKEIVLLEKEPNAPIWIILGYFSIGVKNRVVEKAGFHRITKMH